MRNNLYMFRHKYKLTQAGMADKIGCHRSTYADIEKGVRDGRPTFWNGLQKAFGLTDTEKGELMKNDTDE